MPDANKILDFFSPEQLINICEEEFAPLRDQIITNLQTKTRSSGKRVNSLDLPEETSGETAASLRTIAEQNNIGLIVSFVGRKGIRGIDEGTSPSEAKEEHGSVENLYYALKPWARDKEAKYGLDYKSINAWFAAKNIWEKGTVLYQEGGGTEIMKDLLPKAVERIDAKITDALDASIYQLLNKTILDETIEI